MAIKRKAHSNILSAWVNLGFTSSMLMLEAQQVVGLRLLKMSLGGKASSREARLMVSEKAFTLGETAMMAATGASADAVVRKYRKKVRANRRRLTRT